MSVTRRELARSLGITKQTVANYVSRLGLQDHVSRDGQADVLDDFAASAIADAVGKAMPARDVEAAGQTAKESAPAGDPLIAALNARIDDLKAQNEQLGRVIESKDREIESRDREILALREQISASGERAADLAARLAGIAERQQVIAAAPWWRRGRVAMRLLGPGDPGQDA